MIVTVTVEAGHRAIRVLMARTRAGSEHYPPAAGLSPTASEYRSRAGGLEMPAARGGCTVTAATVTAAKARCQSLTATDSGSAAAGRRRGRRGPRRPGPGIGRVQFQLMTYTDDTMSFTTLLSAVTWGLLIIGPPELQFS